MQVHQLLAGAAPGDAVTRIALRTQQLLSEFAHSETFAHHLDPALSGVVSPLAHLPVGTADDVLIVRASIGDDALFDLLADRPERLFVAYHNITPARFFYDLDPGFAELLRSGREQLTALAPRVSAAWADSSFNAEDLMSLGYSDVEVIRPAIDPFHLTQVGPEPSLAVQLDHLAPQEMVLFVGQLLPHKRPELIIEAMHLLISHHRPRASLVLVGAHRFPKFIRQLRALTSALALPRVLFTDSVTDEQLGELYRRADVFVTASSHEGFCVPVLEAMAASVPVVASRAGALPETVGSGGLLLDEPGPVAIAEALDLALMSETRSELVLAGRRRAHEMSLGAALEDLERFLNANL